MILLHRHPYPELPDHHKTNATKRTRTLFQLQTFGSQTKSKKLIRQYQDTDDAESVYLSSDEEDTSDEDSSDYDSDSECSVEELPPRQLSRRATDRGEKTNPGPPFTITQTRSETTRWVSTQNNGGLMRGARTVNQQTTLHGHNANRPQQQRPSNRNSISFNMSVNVDMSFNGLVTGRNLGFTGGSLSYAWSRRNTQGG
ncbi:hypothetical protein FVEG_05133 [Fusarium verticillioides 7600]|uniref:Uncharacterized protein n=1 Tax=Gibberella moniliformis (strain M3125 / FGSC 7600) TaxID=334819 RepID=W7LX04_GIBM7|nr:hypothetical protein FVEG_05133 [Fusarium verticillioides 7600]EWG43823.1 hypothetical protein FVEG_05133 [Fusarium verticillioides 7600]